MGHGQTIFTARDGNLHDAGRRIASPVFSRQSLLDMQPNIESLLNLWVEKLGLASKDGREAFDVLMPNRQAAFDIVGEVCFGQSLGMLEGKNDE